MAELFDTTLRDEDTPLSREALIEAMRECDVLVPTVTDRIDAAMIADAGDRLGLIASFGAGTDHIDLAAAHERRIIVTNTPGVFTDDTADMALAMIIGVPRRIREGVALVRRDEWSGWAPSNLLGRQLGERRSASWAWAASARRWRTARAPSGWRSSITIASACPARSRPCSARAGRKSWTICSKLPTS